MSWQYLITCKNNAYGIAIVIDNNNTKIELEERDDGSKSHDDDKDLFLIIEWLKEYISFLIKEDKNNITLFASMEDTKRNTDWRTKRIWSHYRKKKFKLMFGDQFPFKFHDFGIGIIIIYKVIDKQWSKKTKII